MPEPRSQTFVFAAMLLIAGLAISAAGWMFFSTLSNLNHDQGLESAAVTPFQAFEGPPHRHDTLSTPNDVTTEFVSNNVLSTDEWDVLEPIDAEAFHSTSPIETSRPGQVGRGNSTIVVITNFTRAEVFVNDDPYPAYFDSGTNEGLRVPSGQENIIRVRYDGNEKLYRLSLRPGERRLLMVELTGFSSSGQASTSPPRERQPPPERARDNEDIPDEEAQITVYSRPRGTIFVDETDRGEETPGTVSVDPGRREVQVRYEDGELSETKVVRAREGSRIKLFFRQDN